tara:strand:- start:11893 stop:12084 length:192 start_codon:yes stop_codon:yes gene_type:complete
LEIILTTCKKNHSDWSGSRKLTIYLIEMEFLNFMEVQRESLRDKLFKKIQGGCHHLENHKQMI